MTDPSASPPTTTAAAGTNLDRLQSELQVLLQEARQTQAAIAQMQARESTGPSVDQWFRASRDMELGHTEQAAGVGLVLATAAVAWWLWRTYWARRNAVPDWQSSFASLPQETAAPPSASVAPTPQRTAVSHPAESLETLESEFSESAFFAFAALADTPAAPAEAPGRFDSEAAASEVVRVRKSLAEKRQARAILGQREEAAPEAWEPPREESFQAEPLQEEPMTDFGLFHPDIDLDSMALEPLATSTTPGVPEQAPAPAADPEPPEVPASSDDAIKLELAQEALLLDLLPQARELALEVLEKGDSIWAPEAEAMVSRVDQLEFDTKQARLNWR